MKTTKIIAIGGKRKSGKNTTASYIAGLCLYSRKIIDNFSVLSNNNLLVSEQEVYPNIINPNVVKIYGFADFLKDIAVKLFDVEPALVYGSDDDKEGLTHLCWDNMPGVVTDEKFWKSLKKWHNRRIRSLGKENAGSFDFVYHKPGRMSGRDFMTYFATEICRKIYGPCWIKATEKSIMKDRPEFALIADMRFDNEKAWAKKMGAYTFLLTREIHKKDTHKSEQGFSETQDFDFVVDNQDGDLPNLFQQTVYGLNRLQVLSP